MTHASLTDYYKRAGLANTNTFTPSPNEEYDIHAYLQDVDFHLQRLDNVTTQG